MYPTSIDELFAVADEQSADAAQIDLVEPKLRSGLFIHKLSE